MVARDWDGDGNCDWGGTAVEEMVVAATAVGAAGSGDAAGKMGAEASSTCG